MRNFYLFTFIFLLQMFYWPENILFADEKILFVSDKDELANWDIYSMNLDGSGITRLTDSSSIENHPDLSSDGSTVVFSSDLTGNFEIYTSPLITLSDETTWTQLTNFGCTSTICIPARHPHWSPDGTKIIYTAKTGCRPPGKIVSQCSVPIEPDCREDGESGVPFEQIHMMNSDGTNDTVLDVQSLDSRIVHVGHPSFSPDGKKIVLSAAINDNATDWEVFTIDWDGSNISNLQQITQGSKYKPNPNPIKMTGGATFSLDGKWIYCSSTRTNRGNSQLFRVPADSKKPVKISDKYRMTWTCGNDYVPTPVSGDGSEEQIIFTCDGIDLSDASGSPEWDLDICTLNSDGSERTNLTGNNFPSEMLLIADEVSWFCGLPSNLTDCKFTPRAVSVESKFLMFNSENELPADFPNRDKYPQYMEVVGNYMEEQYPEYLGLINQYLLEYQNDPNNVQVAYHQIVIPSMMPEIEACSDCVEILTSSLPNGKLKEKYKAGLKADQKVKSWELIAGKLPSGLQLNPKKGIISGRPKETGTFPFTMAAIRKGGNADSKDLSITIE